MRRKKCKHEKGCRRGGLSEDKTTHDTVIEYAVQEMIKRGGGPAKAAKSTARKLSGSENLFLGAGIVEIDATRLEELLWERLTGFVCEQVGRVKAEKSHYALDFAISHFRLPKSARRRLKAEAVARGCDLFLYDDGGEKKK